MQRAYCVLNMWPPIKIICNHLVTNASVLSVNTFLQKHRRRIKADNWCLWKEDSYIMFGRRRGHLSTNLYGLVTYTAPWKKIKFFGQLQSREYYDGMGRPRGLRRFRKNHLENILPCQFRDRDPRYPKGVTKHFFRKMFPGKVIGV